MRRDEKGKLHTMPKRGDALIHTVKIKGSKPVAHEVYINGMLLGTMTKAAYIRTWDVLCNFTAEIRQVQGFDRAVEELLHMHFDRKTRVSCTERLYFLEQI